VRRQPHNPEAERGLLGAIIYRTTDWADAQHVTETDLYVERHRRIWSAIAWLVEQDHPISATGVISRLTDTSSLDMCGGAVGVYGLRDSDTIDVQALHYADLVLADSRRRKVIAVAGEVVEAGYSGDADAAAGTGAERLMLAIESKQSDRVTIGESAKQAFATIEATAEGGGNAHLGLRVGLRAFDGRSNHGVGILPGQVVVVAARPGIGKTALALALSTGARIGKHDDDRAAVVEYLSLEMGHSELTTRALASRSGIDLAKLIRGDVRDEQWGDIINATAWLSRLPVTFADRGGVTAMQVGQWIVQSARRGVDLVVVDHLHEVTRAQDQTKLDDNSFYGRTMKMIKALAKRHGVRVIVLAQCNRQAEGVRPELHHVRGSGGIEESADTLMFLHRDRRESVMQLIWAKVRGGVSGDSKLYFDGSLQRLRDLSIAEEMADEEAKAPRPPKRTGRPGEDDSWPV